MSAFSIALLGLAVGVAGVLLLLSSFRRKQAQSEGVMSEAEAQNQSHSAAASPGRLTSNRDSVTEPKVEVMSKDADAVSPALDEFAEQIDALLKHSLFVRPDNTSLVSRWAETKRDVLQHKFATQQVAALTRKLVATKGVIDAFVSAKLSYLEAQKKMHELLADIAKLKADAAAYGAHEVLIKEDSNAVYKYPLTDAKEDPEAELLKARAGAEIAVMDKIKRKALAENQDDAE